MRIKANKVSENVNIGSVQKTLTAVVWIWNVWYKALLPQRQSLSGDSSALDLTCCKAEAV